MIITPDRFAYQRDVGKVELLDEPNDALPWKEKPLRTFPVNQVFLTGDSQSGVVLK